MDTNTNRWTYNKFDLGFTDASLERIFHRQFVESSLGQIRFAIIIGLCVYSLFFLNDTGLYKEYETAFLSIRFFIVIPVILLGFAATFIPDYYRFAEFANAFAILVAGLGICLMGIAGRNHPEINRISGGILPVFIFLHVFMRLRFRTTLVMGTIVLVAQSCIEIALFKSSHMIIMANISYMAAAHGIGSFTSYILEQTRKNEFILRQQLEDASIHDSLSHLKNRHYFNKVLAPKFTKLLATQKATETLSRRAADPEKGAPFLLVLDLDHFKRINDEFGHPDGDRVIMEVSEALSSLVRKDDEILRWGGEEFLVILEYVTADCFEAMVRKVGLCIAGLDIAISEGRSVHSTVSIGAIALDSRRGSNIDHFISLADAAMYEAKKSGRNCGVLHNDDDTRSLVRWDS